MKVGITGASGFLGSKIIAEAREKHWSVVAYTRNPERQIEGVAEVRSIQDREKIDFSGLDALVHLAGEPIVGLWTKEKKRRIRESRVDLTEDVVECLANHSRDQRPSVLVSASAVGFYGNRGDEILDEEADVGFGFLSEVCRDWEAAAVPAGRLGIRVVSPRLGIVMGRDGFLKRLRPVFNSYLGGVLGNGEQWMSWIHVEDAARIFIQCIENGTIHGRVNCVAPGAVTNREFTRSYAEVLGRKAFLRTPATLLRRLPGGMASLFLDSQRVDPVVLKAYEFEWNYPDLVTALRAIESGEA